MPRSRGTPTLPAVSHSPPISLRVGVVHPCGSLEVHLDALRAGVDRLREAGHTIRIDPACSTRNWRGYLAGTDTERVDELASALTDPHNDVVWFARGGSGGGRIVAELLDRVAQAVPRPVVGFSDATSLLNALATHLGWPAFHGPVLTSVGRGAPEADLSEVARVVRGEQTELAWSPGPGETDSIEGVLVGGNLTVLASMVGTGCLRPPADALWLLEEVGEPPWRIDRCLWQLRACGWLEGARGVWLGDLDLDGDDFARCVEVIREDLAGVPVYTGAPAGHRGRIGALPLGREVRLDPSAGRVSWDG